MPDFSQGLPARKASITLLAKLDLGEREKLNSELLDALWDAHEQGTLPSSIAQLLRDWVAHAHFEDSSVAQQRLREARQGA
jgi:hypothetical protein